MSKPCAPNKRALRVTHLITRLVIGGAQENTLSTIRGLIMRPDLRVNLVAGPAIGPEGSLAGTADSLYTDGGPGSLVEPPLIIPELVRPVHPWKDWVALRKLVQVLRRQQPDIVHTHSGKAGILGRMAAQKAGVPIIIHHIHGPSFGPFQGRVANLIFTAAEQYAGRMTHHFFCSAAAMTQLYLEAGIGRPEQYTRIFSGFDLVPFLHARNDLALRRQLGLEASHFVIGKVARIFHLKGHADLLRAFARIKHEVPQARLLLVGDGVLRAEMEQLARALGIRDQVVFTGLVPPTDVARYVGIMDCLAHLSYREALSRALPQALAAGKPVVAYDFDGADEVCLENQTGFLVKTGDIESASRQLIRLAQAPALRTEFGRCGREFVRQNFAIEKMVSDQYAVYQKLAATRGLPA
ncbi:MAG TPA: glycosyltransferase family 4 protein [Verrucomicrobiae bacterium]